MKNPSLLTRSLLCLKLLERICNRVYGLDSILSCIPAHTVTHTHTRAHTGTGSATWQVACDIEITWQSRCGTTPAEKNASLFRE
jgi:hypothetical protein